MNKRDMLSMIQSVKLCMMPHPSNTIGSEFEDRINDLVEIEKELEKQVNGMNTEQEALHKHIVIQSAFPDIPDDEIYDAACELYKTGKLINATLLIKRHTTMNPAQAKQYCDSHFA